jgi:hypothetical protein
MTSVGAVELDDLHSYKAAIKKALGGNEGISRLLGADRHNFDFWVGRDGTIYISDNGLGGEGGVDTELDFFEMFPEYAPEEVEVAAQPDRGDIDAVEEDDQPQRGDVYDGENGKRYYVAHADGSSYEVLTDNRGNDYVVDAKNVSHWVGDY